MEGGVFEAEVVGAGGGGDLALFAGAEEAEAGGVLVRWRIGGGRAYFSQVDGVWSLKSSMVMRPAGCAPIAMSRKTRGRTMAGGGGGGEGRGGELGGRKGEGREGWSVRCGLWRATPGSGGTLASLFQNGDRSPAGVCSNWMP